MTLAAIPNALAQLQVNRWEISRPWYEAWAGLVYPLVTLATLGWIIAVGVAIGRKGASPSSGTTPRSVSREAVAATQPRSLLSS
ncbi:hypothetical protein D8S82_33540 [Mycobacterium hodleri]|uniref:Uncharacterized protein n=1 Tax=Mycolicibacterium hodleri TaxID=49897 RepID=A0A544VQC5_9MYCO|nr:hypothetical protein D8S82_33540 [Mycolicibacterium hodleri]